MYLIGYNQGYMTEDPTLNLRDYNRGYATAMQYANTHMVYNSCDVE